MNRVVVVIGMDRSGTSLCANLLQDLGLRLGTTLRPGDRFNEAGYYENNQIWSIHERILAILGRSWDTLTAIRPFPPMWWRTEEMQRFKAKLTALVREEVSAGPGPWGFKDPRTAMLLPLWDDVFQACGVEPVFVLCVRHPAAVAKSLATRDDFPRLFSELLWLERNLNACEALQGLPHCLVHYENWFHDSLRQAKILIEATQLTPPQGVDALQKCVAATIRPGLRHDASGTPHISSAAAREFYTHLRHAAKVPSAEVIRFFATALDTARDCTAVAQLLTGRTLTAGMQSPVYSECTPEDMEIIRRDLPPPEHADNLDRDQELLRAATSTLSEQLPLKEEPARVTFDRVAGTEDLSAESQPVPVGQQTDLIVTGWALDGIVERPASAVEILIDGIPFRARYGIERQDVADYFRVPEYLHCGFAFTIKARLLSRGQHVLTARVVSMDGSEYRQSPELAIVVL